MSSIPAYEFDLRYSPPDLPPAGEPLRARKQRKKSAPACTYLEASTPAATKHTPPQRLTESELKPCEDGFGRTLTCPAWRPGHTSFAIQLGCGDYWCWRHGCQLKNLLERMKTVRTKLYADPFQHAPVGHFTLTFPDELLPTASEDRVADAAEAGTKLLRRVYERKVAARYKLTARAVRNADLFGFRTAQPASDKRDADPNRWRPTIEIFLVGRVLLPGASKLSALELTLTTEDLAEIRNEWARILERIFGCTVPIVVFHLSIHTKGKWAAIEKEMRSFPGWKLGLRVRRLVWLGGFHQRAWTRIVATLGIRPTVREPLTCNKCFELLRDFIHLSREHRRRLLKRGLKVEQWELDATKHRSDCRCSSSCARAATLRRQDAGALRQVRDKACRLFEFIVASISNANLRHGLDPLARVDVRNELLAIADRLFDPDAVDTRDGAHEILKKLEWILAWVDTHAPMGDGGIRWQERWRSWWQCVWTLEPEAIASKRPIVEDLRRPPVSVNTVGVVHRLYELVRAADVRAAAAYAAWASTIPFEGEAFT